MATHNQLDSVLNATNKNRIGWIDIIKGASILWIVFFHFFAAYDIKYPWILDQQYISQFIKICAPLSPWDTMLCISKSLWIAVIKLGYQAVGVFIVTSGFGLTYSVAKKGGSINRWHTWYLKRLLRLFPMYWAAHLVFLISPFVFRPEPIDYRFLLSFFGDRICPLYSIFYYANPAWWFFGLLLELYLVFPILFFTLKRFGVLRFLILCGCITFITRLLLIVLIPVHWYYVQGAFFGARLGEFALGMALGWYYNDLPAAIGNWVSHAVMPIIGAICYALGILSYRWKWSLVFTDLFLTCGIFLILTQIARFGSIIPIFTRALAYLGTFSYGLYLLHQPYVIYFGELMRNLSLSFFVFYACIIMAFIIFEAICLESIINRLTYSFQVKL
jgi:peptidoglycan/LPS O-acetylase OafA/YrhL